MHLFRDFVNTKRIKSYFFLSLIHWITILLYFFIVVYIFNPSFFGGFAAKVLNARFSMHSGCKLQRVAHVKKFTKFQLACRLPLESVKIFFALNKVTSLFFGEFFCM